MRKKHEIVIKDDKFVEYEDGLIFIESKSKTDGEPITLKSFDLLIQNLISFRNKLEITEDDLESIHLIKIPKNLVKHTEEYIKTVKEVWNDAKAEFKDYVNRKL